MKEAQLDILFLKKITHLLGKQLKTMKPLSTTRWSCRSNAVQAIRINYVALVDTLEEILNLTKLPDVKAKGSGLLFQLKTFELILCLEIMHPILLQYPLFLYGGLKPLYPPTANGRVRL